MENFNERVLDKAARKFFCWFRYVDGTFFFWPSGPQNT
jgi:hypothetical protein